MCLSRNISSIQRFNVWRFSPNSAPFVIVRRFTFSSPRRSLWNRWEFKLAKHPLTLLRKYEPRRARWGTGTPWNEVRMVLLGVSVAPQVDENRPWCRYHSKNRGEYRKLFYNVSILSAYHDKIIANSRAYHRSRKGELWCLSAPPLFGAIWNGHYWSRCTAECQWDKTRILRGYKEASKGGLEGRYSWELPVSRQAASA